MKTGFGDALSFFDHQGARRKDMLKRWLPRFPNGRHRAEGAEWTFTPEVIPYTETHKWDAISDENPWLAKQELIAKPDQLVKR